MIELWFQLSTAQSRIAELEHLNKSLEKRLQEVTLRELRTLERACYPPISSAPGAVNFVEPESSRVRPLWPWWRRLFS